ncbi:MAG: alpha/beta hydrolase [Hyphomonadaceae bacterium JAD_PAG50586_4]|nr:MAG: alpha/beta hydrolase [Hyphomonadaceae bacterium JAD_PAG50586_4]
MSYASARDAIAACLRKAGAARQSELVSLLTQQAGYLPTDRDGAARALRDIFGLSPREAELALLLSEGHTRSEAAAAAALSDSVAKDAFERVFIALGVSSAPQVSRVAAEAFAASLLPQTPTNIVWSDAVHGEPLRLIARTDGGRIAVSDFGPSGGNPVLIVHSSATTRHPARSLVRALQAAGHRPLAIDRPGFGLSDMRDDDPDPFKTAAHDMKRLCDVFGIARLDIIARGARTPRSRSRIFIQKGAAASSRSTLIRSLTPNPSVKAFLAQQSTPFGGARTSSKISRASSAPKPRPSA